MRISQSLFFTLREFPGDADTISYKLLAKAGMIVKSESGLFSYTPILWRTIKKIRQIISGELERINAQEMMFPSTQKEDAVNDFINHAVQSYKQLPRILYQHGLIFHDKAHPGMGLLSPREQLVTNVFSFDKDEGEAEQTIKKIRNSFDTIFSLFGLEVTVVKGLSEIAALGENDTFLVRISSAPEEYLFCEKPECSYKATNEAAKSGFDHPYKAEFQSMHKEPTPCVKTVDQLCAFFPDLSPSRMVKTILYNVRFPGSGDFKTIAVLIRGDQNINEKKVQNALNASYIAIADDETVKKVTGAEVGFAGPFGFVSDDRQSYTIRIIADETVRGMTNFLCGMNETDFHALDVNFNHDLPEPRFYDLRNASQGEPCPDCGKPLLKRNGVRLGAACKGKTKSSELMNSSFRDRNGREFPFFIGHYQLNVSRIVASVVEMHHDRNGIVWPPSIAPFDVYLLAINIDKEPIREVSEKIYRELSESGFKVLFDDRAGVSPGVKFADADLLGIPCRINVGRSASEGKVEIVERYSGKKDTVSLESLKFKIILNNVNK